MTDIVLENVGRQPVRDQEVEFVERKGQGHPDYLIDACCEAVSLELSKSYLDVFGEVLHHNVDKGLLVGGQAEWRFGGGDVVTPISITVAGRASSGLVDREDTIDIERVGERSVRDTLDELVRHLDPAEHVDIEFKVREGSEDLKRLIERNGPLANDTSFGVGYYPMTTTEEITYELERFLNSPDFKEEHPETGEDVKVMSLRKDDDLYVTLSLPVVDKYVAEKNSYLQVVEEAREEALDYVASLDPEGQVAMSVNSADDLDEEKIYMTVTGTSAEAGDDGNTGRGNRANGLITPNRQMSLEAVAGKNPVNHVGKIYNVLAFRMSRRIYQEVSEVEEAYVRLLSRIGNPLDAPEMASVQLVGGSLDYYEEAIEGIIEEELGRIPDLTESILERRERLF